MAKYVPAPIDSRLVVVQELNRLDDHQRLLQVIASNFVNLESLGLNKIIPPYDIKKDIWLELEK